MAPKMILEILRPESPRRVYSIAVDACLIFGFDVVMVGCKMLVMRFLDREGVRFRRKWFMRKGIS